MSDAPPDTRPRAQLERASDAAGDVLRLTGAWRLAGLGLIDAELRALRLPARLTVDASQLAELDSAAALALLSHLPPGVQWRGLAANDTRIIEQVRTRIEGVPDLPPHRHESAFEVIGRRANGIARMGHGHLAFLGAAVLGIVGTILHPRRLRVRELTAQFEQVGLNAIPVVSLVTLLIGVVVAYLLGLQAEKYGANIFVVDGVGIGATREFAPIIVAIIVAGRSGAAFTAQLGSMRLTEETRRHPHARAVAESQVLVLPRVLALMLALPLLVFVGDVMSLFGAMLIAGRCSTSRRRPSSTGCAIALRHPACAASGWSKAPVFALVIAVIGARMGMTVGRDTRALGAATTSTVVQCIVAVILLDAAFAVLLPGNRHLMERDDAVIEVDRVVTRFGRQTVHDGVSASRSGAARWSR